MTHASAGRLNHDPLTPFVIDRQGPVNSLYQQVRRAGQTVKYVHWQEGDAWLGYLQDYPDYWAQGDTLDDLIDHLKDRYLDFSGGHIPGIRKVGELLLP